MSSNIKTNKQLQIICNKCSFPIEQIPSSIDTFVYCPACDNVFDLPTKENNKECDNHDEEYKETKMTLIEENYLKAYMEIPQTFIRSEPIFIKGFINGHEILFLLDTGAESSFIPVNIIESCGISNLIDKTYATKLIGVGESKTVGKIHYIEVVFDCGVYACSFGICENNNLPPILGIDMMYNLGIQLDFKNKKIIFTNDCSLPFINKSRNPN